MREAPAKFLKFFEEGPLRLKMEEAERETIRSLAVSEKFYAKGASILEEGFTSRSLLFASTGWAISYKSMSNGKRLVSDFPLRGDLLSSGSVIGKSYRSVAAATDVSTFELAPGDINSLSIGAPRVFMSLLRLVARNFGIATERLASVSRRRPIERTIWLFLEMAHRLTQSGTAVAGSYDFPFTQGDLADALGLTSIHMNRVLGEMRRRNLVTFRNGRVELFNAQALQDMILFDPEYLSLHWAGSAKPMPT